MSMKYTMSVFLFNKNQTFFVHKKNTTLPYPTFTYSWWNVQSFTPLFLTSWKVIPKKCVIPWLNVNFTTPLSWKGWTQKHERLFCDVTQKHVQRFAWRAKRVHCLLTKPRRRYVCFTSVHFVTLSWEYPLLQTCKFTTDLLKTKQS